MNDDQLKQFLGVAIVLGLLMVWLMSCREFDPPFEGRGQDHITYPVSIAHEMYCPLPFPSPADDWQGGFLGGPQHE